MFAEVVRIALLAGTVGLVSNAPTVYDDVDVIELNHVYDTDGRLVLRQLIFWDWHASAARHHVVAWRLWKMDQPSPTRDWHGGSYQLLFRDGQILRDIRARSYCETWTQFDPEIDDRSSYSPSRRRGLSTADWAGPGSKAEFSQR